MFVRTITALFFVVCLIGIVSAGSESYVSVEGYVGGGGGIISHHTTESTIGNGIDTNYNQLAAGSRVLTGPGNSQYKENTKLDAAIDNLYESGSELMADGGYIYDDTSSMVDKKIAIPELDGKGASNQTGQTPSKQSVDTHADGMGYNVTYTADTVIEDANLTVDYRAEGGAGVFDSRMSAEIEAGLSKNSAETKDYVARTSDRKTAYGNSTSTLFGLYTIKYRDFSRPMGFGDANVSVTVESPVVNIGNTP